MVCNFTDLKHKHYVKIMIRLIAIWIMKNRLKKAQKDQLNLDNSIVSRAYDDMIKNYKNTLMFLEANSK